MDKEDDLELDTIVRTEFNLKSMNCLGISEKSLDARKPDKEGVVLQRFLTHGEFIYIVKHKDETVAPYRYDELTLI